jgi:hypothetical protein
MWLAPLHPILRLLVLPRDAIELSHRLMPFTVVYASNMPLSHSLTASLTEVEFNINYIDQHTLTDMFLSALKESHMP